MRSRKNMLFLFCALIQNLLFKVTHLVSDRAGPTILKTKFFQLYHAVSKG